jgi:rhamnosyltransferase
MTSPRVAAYITAYEDAEALNTCLAALQCQSYAIEKILVVDNSRQPLTVVAQDPRIQVFHHPENIGIAGGICLAVEQCWSEGFDFLWMFDQDSKPASDCLELLLENYTEQAGATYPIGIIAPHAIDARTGATVEPGKFLGDRFRGYKAPSLTEPFECDAPITSGSLLWLKTHLEVPPPDAKLFMDGIDLDYGWRLRLAGFHNVLVPTAKMYHRFGEPIVVKLFGKKKIFQRYSPLRHYYICRNHTYLELKYSQGFNRLKCIWKRIEFLLKNIIIIFLFDTQSSFQKTIACMIGTCHGFQGNLNESWK